LRQRKGGKAEGESSKLKGEQWIVDGDEGSEWWIAERGRVKGKGAEREIQNPIQKSPYELVSYKNV
jgi:hypothetical protein